MRKKIKFKATLAGSSDPIRVKAAKTAREINHRENVNFFLSIKAEIELTDDSPVIVIIGGKEITVPFKVAKSAKYSWRSK